jgi:protein gp37
MAIKTKISYCDSTINPMMGCTGCELYHPDPSKNHCYAATLINRYAGNKGWPNSFNEMKHFPERLDKALRWRDLTGKDRPNKPWLNGYPRIIFVNDLSDGFCPGADPEEWLTPYLDMMAQSPHIWLLLTKWPDKMRYCIGNYNMPDNFWLGVSVLRQRDAWRVEELLKIDAKIRWASMEPLLGPVILNNDWLAEPGFYMMGHGRCEWCGWFTCTCGRKAYETESREPNNWLGPHLDWIVCGGESGPNARPMHLDWVLSLKQQCIQSGISFHMKQWGEWLPSSQSNEPRSSMTAYFEKHAMNPFSRVGKEAAGCKLDGVEYHEMPNVR